MNCFSIHYGRACLDAEMFLACQYSRTRHFWLDLLLCLLPPLQLQPRQVSSPGPWPVLGAWSAKSTPISIAGGRLKWWDPVVSILLWLIVFRKAGQLWWGNCAGVYRQDRPCYADWLYKHWGWKHITVRPWDEQRWLCMRKVTFVQQGETQHSRTRT